MAEPTVPRPSNHLSPCPGIYWLAPRRCWKVTADVGGRKNRRTKSKCFPEDTLPSKMMAWQRSTKRDLRALLWDDFERGAARDPKAPETFIDAATAYLKTVTAMPSYESRCHDLRAWVKQIGPRAVRDLSHRDLVGTWNGWRAAGVAPSTLNHRRTALLSCLKYASPDLVALAREHVPRMAEAQDVPREIPYDDIQELLASMPPGRCRAMLRVFAETGHPPSTIQRLTAEDVDLKHGRVRLPTRRKGRMVSGVVLPLTPAAVAAFQELLALTGWERITRQSLGIVWGRALERVNATRREAKRRPIPDCTPYCLRHSFAGMVLDATGGDLQATKELLQHSDLETTLRYARGRVRRSVEAAAKAITEYQSRPCRTELIPKE